MAGFYLKVISVLNPKYTVRLSLLSLSAKFRTEDAVRMKSDTSVADGHDWLKPRADLEVLASSRCRRVPF